MEPKENQDLARRITVTLRDAATIVSAVGILLNGVARVTRETRHAGSELNRWRRNRQRNHTRRRGTKPVNTITLYRPVGQKEYDLIVESGMRSFPPRLPSQPIFYPVLEEAYAVQIARDWNTKDGFSGFMGYVTRFVVRADFLANYEIKTVGAADLHREYWIPVEDLPALNASILEPIEVVAEFRGAGATV